MTMLSDGMLLGGGGYTYEEVQSLPAMTADNAPAGHLVSGSNLAGGVSAFWAFNQTTALRCSFGAGGNGSVYRKTPSQITVWKYRIQSPLSADANRAIKDWKFQGSNDGSSWTDLSIVTGQVGWGDLEKRDFIVSSPAPFSYHRINFTSNNGDVSFSQITEIELLQRLG